MTLMPLVTANVATEARVIEDVQLLRTSDATRADLIASHMQRIILHLVFKDPQVVPAYPSGLPLEDLLKVVRPATRRAFDKVAAYVELHHPNDYLANFSKNAEKCERLVRGIVPPPRKDPVQGQLL